MLFANVKIDFFKNTFKFFSGHILLLNYVISVHSFSNSNLLKKKKKKKNEQN